MTLQPPSDGPTPGRRDNGLASSEWGALVDLDPRLSEALLDRLAADGVAAYVEPARDVDTVSRATTHPKRPLDRLWVDPALAELARGIVASEVAELTALLAEEHPGATAHGLVRPVPRTAAMRVLSPPELPGPPASPVPATAPTPGPAEGLDDDEMFRQIVAGFSTDPDAPVPPWPVSEEIEPSPAPRRRTAEPAEPAAPARPREQAGDDEQPLPGWVEPEAVEDDGHFVPPPPPPVPRIRRRTVGAALLMALGFVLLFRPALVMLSDTGGVLLLGMACAAGGAALLISGMRDAPPTDSGPDDGAVV